VLPLWAMSLRVARHQPLRYCCIPRDVAPLSNYLKSTDQIDVPQEAYACTWPHSIRTRASRLQKKATHVLYAGVNAAVPPHDAIQRSCCKHVCGSTAHPGVHLYGERRLPCAIPHPRNGLSTRRASASDKNRVIWNTVAMPTYGQRLLTPPNRPCAQSMTGRYQDTWLIVMASGESCGCRSELLETQLWSPHDIDSIKSFKAKISPNPV
jgi:hypothetical protein